MKVAVMQPYFFPYLGYIQLMKAVDRFVFLDDVNYINRGWINRNRINRDGAPAWVTMPLVKASQNRRINEIDIQPRESWLPKMRNALGHAYGESSYKEQGLAVFDECMAPPDINLAGFLKASLQSLSQTLSIETEFLSASDFPPGELRGQERILDLCKTLGATTYINPPGGRELYDEAAFNSRDIELQFLQPDLTPEGIRCSTPEGAVLSILDLIFLNPLESVATGCATG